MLHKDEFKQKINSVVEHIKNNDTNSATAEILKVIDDYNQGFDEIEDLTSKNTDLTNEINGLNTKISALKDTNLDLLLKVGTTKTPASNINPGQDSNDQKPPLKYEDLFNEKGELK